MNIELTLKVQDLNARYVRAIDDNKLEAWPDFFTEHGRYRITTAENVERGLPLGMIYATSRAMLRDRVRSLRDANVYEAQRYRHIVGPPLIETGEGGVVAAQTSFIVARIMHTGETTLFATGRYRDQRRLRGRRRPLRREARDPRQPADRHAARDSAVTDPAASSLLRHRSFVLFWCARTFTNGAFMMQGVAVGWQIYDLTNDPLDLGLVGLVQFFPLIAISILAGQVLDLFDRRMVAAVCQIGKALAALALAVGTAQGWLGREAMFAHSVPVGDGACVRDPDHAFAAAGRRADGRCCRAPSPRPRPRSRPPSSAGRRLAGCSTCSGRRWSMRPAPSSSSRRAC